MTQRTVLLDTCMLIGAYDSDGNNVEHTEARKEIEALLSDPDIDIAITPLIRFEFLRGVRRATPEATEAAVAKMNTTLNSFQEFDVKGVHGRLAAELYRRYCETEGKPERRNMEKLSMDIFHCVCADIHNLQIVSRDSHISKIQQLITDSRQP